MELIQDLPADAHISFYKQGEFTDLCAGPHLDSTGRIKGNAIKLTACNAAYWRGDSNRRPSSGSTASPSPRRRRLDAYLQRIEEAKKRDHRKLGKELGLFMLRDEGPGFPFFLPKGMVLKNTLLDYWRQVHKSTAMWRSPPPSSSTASCGSGPATGITISRTCTPPSSTGRITPSSP